MSKNTPSRMESCVFGIRCLKTTFVAATALISVITVITVYRFLSHQPLRLSSQLLHNVTFTKFTVLSGNSTTRPTHPLLYSEQKDAFGKMILWHMIPRYRKHGPDQYFKCKNNNKCILSNNRSQLAMADAVIVDAFLLSRNRVKDTPVRTSPNQAWIFFTLEPWSNYGSLYPKAKWDNIINWTMTYNRDSDFPMTYGDVFKRTKKRTINWEKVMKMKTKSVFWLVSHCHTVSKREVYVDQLKKHIDVDIVGFCGRRSCVENGTWAKVIPCYQRSRFYLAFESTLCQDYVTEKFFRTFYHHIIPVVRGKANYSRICPKDLYINTADFESPKKLAEYLKYLERNTTAYLGYLKRRAEYMTSRKYYKICDICSHLHQLDTYRKSYESITEWIGRCDKASHPELH